MPKEGKEAKGGAHSSWRLLLMSFEEILEFGDEICVHEVDRRGGR
jgi:hypothetical protein